VRGIRGTDPSDRNGVQIAAIQALTKRIEQLQARVVQLKRQRAGGRNGTR
jgi:hypothetical protein